ncbi:hypothetical protein ABEF95_002046 [Exophiala dermatitidis]
MSNQGYYGGPQGGYPQQPGATYQPGYGAPPQPGYGAPQQGYYQQGPPQMQAQPQTVYVQERRSNDRGCLGTCLAALCCCFVCEEGWRGWYQPRALSLLQAQEMIKMKKETSPKTCNILSYAKGSPVQSILKNGPQPTAVSVLRRLVSTTFLRGRAEDRGLWVVAMLRYGEAGARVVIFLIPVHNTHKGTSTFLDFLLMETTGW